jgi:hypothetical protein
VTILSDADTLGCLLDQPGASVHSTRRSVRLTHGRASLGDVRLALEPQQTTAGAASRGPRVRRPSKSR